MSVSMIHPRRVPVWLTAGIGLALAAAAYQTTQQIMAEMADHGHDWWRVLVWQLAGWGYAAAATPVLYRRGVALARARPWWRALPAAAATAAGLIALHLVAVAGVVTLVQHFQPVAVYPFSGALARQFDNWIFLDVVATVGLTVLGFGLASYHRTRQLEIHESQLEAELARAELEALRLQMRPHFLFNSLNSIAALIRRGDGEQALATTLDLGDLLRETVGRSQRDLVPLADELAFLDRYVRLQRVRFGPRLELETRVPEECLAYGTPTLSLQPLVENAIRHGIEARRGALHVKVEAELIGGSLELRVSDDGPGLPPGFELERDSGVGVGNLRRRLHRMFDGRGDLSLEAAGEGGTLARVRVPARRIEPEVRA